MTHTNHTAISTTDIPNLKRIHQGKVRDMYHVDDEHILIVTTDRISAFDVILPTPVPGKGMVLTALSNYWFQHFKGVVANHLSDIPLEEVIDEPELVQQLHDHAIVVKKMQALPVEAIMRGFIIGSGWKDYQKNGAICGIDLPAGLQLADKLPDALYTPSTKAAVGEHDENIDFDKTVALLGGDMARQVRDVSYRLYTEAHEYARAKGIIIADTKFEFGVNKAGDLVLIDEVLTPDSSRFWDPETYVPGNNPDSYDKQYVRDYLDTLDWDKTVPGPEIPADVIAKTREKYLEAKRRLTA
jgi:phosphoribosylaminoimidazole-succinocarboxamide synthase